MRTFSCPTNRHRGSAVGALLQDVEDWRVKLKTSHLTSKLIIRGPAVRGRGPENKQLPGFPDSSGQPAHSAVMDFDERKALHDGRNLVDGAYQPMQAPGQRRLQYRYLPLPLILQFPLQLMAWIMQYLPLTPVPLVGLRPAKILSQSSPALPH